MKLKFMATTVFLLASILPNQARNNQPAYQVRLHVFSGHTKFKTGHSYLEIKNNSNYPIKVGLYTLGPRAGVTVGLWPSSGKEFDVELHNGINYNAESHWFKHNNQPITINDDRSDIYLETYVYSYQFAEVNKLIIDWNNKYNGLQYQCAQFSIKAWNYIAPKDLQVRSWIPGLLRNEIEKKNHYDTTSLNYGDSNFYYENGNQILKYCHE